MVRGLNIELGDGRVVRLKIYGVGYSPSEGKVALSHHAQNTLAAQRKTCS